jgi:hypothetical protein
MAIAVIPDDPKDRGSRWIEALATVALAIVVALFAYAMLSEYVF